MSTYISNYMDDQYLNNTVICTFDDYDNLNSEYILMHLILALKQFSILILMYLILSLKILLITNTICLVKRFCNLFKPNLREKTLEINKKRKRTNEKYDSNKRVKLDTTHKKVKKCYFCNENILNNTKNKKIICNLCDKKSYVVKKIIDDMLNIISKEDRSAKKVELIKSKIFKLKKLRL